MLQTGANYCGRTMPFSTASSTSSSAETSVSDPLSSCPVPGARGFGKPEGFGTNRVLILGEALGEQELKDGGLPFRPSAPAGSVLERAIRKLAMRRDQFVIFNAIPTHPPGDKLEGSWLGEAIAWGKPHISHVIDFYKPKVILALGKTAIMSSTGQTDDIGLLEGYVTPADTDIGCSLLGVIPSFHPAWLRRGKMSHFHLLLRDIHEAVKLAKTGILPAEPELPLSYIHRPTPDDAYRFCPEDNNATIYYDIETYMGKGEDDDFSEGAIKSIQFACEGSGIYLPWYEPFITHAKTILATPNPKAGWNNWRFDDPRLLENGCTINGPNHDLMWMWHHLQPDLKDPGMGLQFAAKLFGWKYAWKHLSASEPERYGLIDVRVLEIMHPKLVASLVDMGIWRGYSEHVLKLEPILRAAGKRGMPISVDQFDKISAKLQHTVDSGEEDFQHLVPDALIPRKIYKKKPPKTLIWKPSNKNLKSYCLAKSYDPPLDYKTKKITFDQLHMKRLYAETKDPLFKAILDYKDAATVLHSHISNWKPDPDGRVHSTFFYHPATGQLSSRRPNIQNAPKHKSDEFRSIVAAEEGKLLIEFDYKAFHALMMGFEAKDKDFIRLVRLDIHSFVTAHFLKLPKRDEAWSMPDDELKDYLDWVKRNHKHERDAKIKHAVLGYNNGMGWWKLYETYKEYFANQGEAKRVNSMLDELFPITAQFRKDIRIKAHEQGYLLSRHGYIRRFHEVLKWTPGGLVPGGEQAEQAVAFLSSNDAFGHIKDAIRELDARGYLEKYGFINTVHDSLLFETDRDLAVECLLNVWPIMEAPSKILIDKDVAPDGLVCQVSASLGPNWANMKEIPYGLDGLIGGALPIPIPKGEERPASLAGF